MTDTPATSRSVHLSASAGSGKTRALKDRYLALLAELERAGLSLDQAVAITFTDKAAAEIKERVIQDLPEAMLKKIIRGRQDLRISTIHSFCMNLLKRYPLEAGLPPDFGVLDDRDKAAAVGRAIEEALEEADRAPGGVSVLRDRPIGDLITVLEHLLSIRSRIKRMEIDAGGPEGLLRAVRSGLGHDRAAADLAGLAAGADWQTKLRRMEEILRAQPESYERCRGTEHRLLSEQGAVDAVMRAAADLAPLYFNKDGSPAKRPAIAKKDFAGKDRKAYEDAFFAVQELLGRAQDLTARVLAGREALGLFGLFQLADRNYEEAKLREGLLDFDDLEIFAYRMLGSATSPEILYWLDRKVLHYLVDEFQDTSDIQWAILNKLTEEIFAGTGADKPMAPTLFVVGDAKQSIYRFREANYRLIDAVKTRMETNLPPERREVRTLDRNYRSTPEVVGTVNQVFSSLWGAGYARSLVERRDHRGSARLIEFLPSPDERGPQEAAEAVVLAREIRAFVNGGSPVYDRDGDRWTERPAGYDDCAVLIQSRTRLKDYEAALKNEGVPFRVVGGLGFYEEDEVQAVLNVLFFLRNNDDRIALAAALRSPLFGLTDSDLFGILRSGSSMLDALLRARSAAGELLDGWRRYANTEQIGGLVHRIIRDAGASIRFGRRNPQAVFNLDKLLDSARDFDRRGYTTLEDFVEWVRSIRASEQREATADMNLPGVRGAVSIMTVHKAKGLEFPVVFLPGMNQQPRSLTAGPPALIEGDGTARLAVKNGENPVYDELWERERKELMGEHQRLLYVALTRSRDHLVMIGALNEGKSPVKPDTWLAYLHAALPGLRSETVPQGSLVAFAYPGWKDEPHRQTGGLPRGTAADADREIDREQVLRNLSPIAAAPSTVWQRATDLLVQDREWSVEQPVPPAGADLQVSPLTRGSVLHRCLEEYTKTGTVDYPAIIAGFPEVAALDEQDRDRFRAGVEAVLAAVTGNGELAWIFHRLPTSYSELPFLLRRGDDIVSGIIDRVVVREGRGFVVDYKSIAVEDGKALEDWMNHYRPQIRTYCEAAKEIFGLERVEGYLLFLDSNRLALTVSM